MKPEAQKLRIEFEQTRNTYKHAESALKNYEGLCDHQFGDAKYDPIQRKAYTIPEEIVMGMRRRGPIYVEAKTEDRWVKECLECGLVQETLSADYEKSTKKIPRFLE